MKKTEGRIKNQYLGRLILTCREGGRPVLVWGILFTLLSIVLFGLKPSLLQHLDFKSYDLLLKNCPVKQRSIRSPVIVDIDEKSLALYGQWPWPRYKVAGLLEKISEMNPAVIALDMVFAEPDRTSAGRLLKELEESSLLTLSIEGLPDELRDNDRILAKTLARGPFVLGNKFHFNKFEKKSEHCAIHPVKVVSIGNSKGMGRYNNGDRENIYIPQSTGVLCNLEVLSERVNTSGFFNFSPDPDGMLRRLPLLIQHDKNIYASLALAAVLKVQNTDTIFLKKDGDILQSLNYRGGSIPIPVDMYGQMLIRFKGANKSYDYISAADIMDGRASSERLSERIVFVGTSADGLKELRTTPFDPVFPGVEVHATVADNILTGDFISVPDWYNGLIILLLLLSGTLFSLVIAFSGAAFSFIVMLLIVAGLWIGTQQAFFSMGLFLGTTFPITSVICTYIFLTLCKYRLGEKKILSGMRELILTQDITIESMANLAEHRDPETGGHIRRTKLYVRLLAEKIKKHDRYRDFLSDANIDMLEKSAPLHDIGKVGIPDNILLKPGNLTEQEFEIMKTHTTIGCKVIEESVRKLGKKSFLTIAAEMAESHQEKWNGQGYPHGLKGDAIPISGRIMAIADVYDALISKRLYKPPFSHAMSVEIIKKGKGIEFDPDIVDAFLEIHEQFRNIALKFADFKEENR